MIHKKWIALCVFIILLVGCQTSDMEKESKNVQTANNDTVQENSRTDEMNTPKTDKSKSVRNENGNLTLHYIDAGQGDATLLQYKGAEENYTILYDTGDWLGSEVVPYLNHAGVDTLDIIIISHPHADHIGQLKNVLESITVDEVWMPGNVASSAVFTEAMEAVSDSNVAYEEPRAGDKYDVGPLELTVLHPDHLSGDLNADSLSIHFQFENTAFLFTGDAYKDGEQKMIDTGLPIEANILQLGHHGSNTSSSDAFIDAVQPEYGIYSAGIDNSYGHPHEEVVSLFEKKGIPLYGTEQYGTIIVTSDGEKIDVEVSESAPVDSEPQAQAQEQEKSKETTDTTADCIDINSASAVELTDIIHIGDARAKELIKLRPYETINDLSKINGIGAKRLAEIKTENKACTKGE